MDCAREPLGSFRIRLVFLETVYHGLGWPRVCLFVYTYVVRLKAFVAGYICKLMNST